MRKDHEGQNDESGRVGRNGLERTADDADCADGFTLGRLTLENDLRLPHFVSAPTEPATGI